MTFSVRRFIFPFRGQVPEAEKNFVALETFLNDKAQTLPIKDDTGDPADPVEGQIYVNTSDNKVRVYADAAWRDLVTW